ncbi:MAG: DUF2834 domain-containing protein [Cyanobacteriota bacterium]|nr:DUF2834 domain-containing protein [Cyanobacteriota bacterium]
MIRGIYLVLCAIGLILPYSQFVPFLWENGLDIPLFLEQLFANRISSFFGWDVIVSSLVLLAFILSEGLRLRMQNLWVAIAGSFFVGVSFSLPLFLLMREQHLLAKSE